MSLRVLLADESLTIKKVMDLALQDFLVQVKAVPSGLDVLDVAIEFKPEIIFIDVLLSKKSGYEVAAEIAKHPSLKGTPCVLMWSGFIEVDPKKVEAAGVAATLEKPFDADQLRKLVKNLVPRLKTNKISDFLNFSDLPPLIEEETSESSTNSPSEAFSDLNLADLEATQVLSPSSSGSFNGSFGGQADPMALSLSGIEGLSQTQSQHDIGAIKKGGSAGINLRNLRKDSEPQPLPPKTEPVGPSSFAALEEFDDFQTVPLPGTKRKDAFSEPSEAYQTASTDLLENWEPKKISELPAELPPHSPPPSPPKPESPPKSESPPKLESKSTSLKDRVDDLKGAILLGDSGDVVPIEALDDFTPIPDFATGSQIKATPQPAPSTLDPVRAEEILREQVSRTIEDIAWKIIPDVAERIIRQEIQKLMEDLDRMKKRNS